jgi:hypothetical protein
MKKFIAAMIALAPAVAFAQQPVRDINSLAVKATGIGNTVIGIFIAAAVVFIIYNILMFIVHAAGEKRGEYQKGILWGIVGLAVILSIWGLVAILTGTFGTTGVNAPAQLYPVNPNPPPVQ